MESWADGELARITAQAPPGWLVWFTRATYRADAVYCWSAMPEGARMAVVTSDDPSRLLREIRSGSCLPGAIGETRELLEHAPAHWTFERAHLIAHLESLLREQHRRAAAP